MNNKKGFVLSTYVYMLLVFFLLLLTTMLAVMNNTKLLSNKLKEQSESTSGLTDKDYSFILLGDSDMILRKGEEYIEPGFKIQTVKGVDLSDIVSITGNVDVNLPNTYKLTYSATYNGITKKLIRNVHVLDDIASNYITGLHQHRKDENNLINRIATYEGIEYDTGIRYSGANPNNYVYFNCENKDINNINYGEENYDYKSSCEIWRIIGVFDVTSVDDNNVEYEEKLLKIVRNETLKDNNSSDLKLSWDSSSEEINMGFGINEWSVSDINTMLNSYYVGTSTTCNYCNGQSQTTCTNICSNSIASLSSNSSQMIQTILWSTGAIERVDVISSLNSYVAERGNENGKQCSSGSYCNDAVARTTQYKGKIGLITPSDYAYASSNIGCNSDIVSNYECTNKNWLAGKSEWFITPNINEGESSTAFRVQENGDIYDSVVSDKFSVRPSLYLKSSIKISSGDGTQNNPYKLSI